MKIGDVIDGKYELVRLIGEGGMGSVFEGRHVHIGRKAALKFLRPEVAGDPELAARFLREAQAAAAVGSEHIVEIYDVGWLPDEQPYLIMELLEGESVATRLHEHRTFEPSEAVAVVLQLCEALEPAHERGIVHRDLKPENLFLTRRAGVEGWLKVLDFGIAKVRSDLASQSPGLTRTGTTLGSPYSMAPEQLMGPRDVDHRADIYSAGVILFNMITGDFPFAAQTYEELIIQLALGSPRSPKELVPVLDDGLASIILRAMARPVDERFGTVRELSEALEPYRDRERCVSRRPSASDSDALPFASTMPADRGGPESVPKTVIAGPAGADPVPQTLFVESAGAAPIPETAIAEGANPDSFPPTLCVEAGDPAIFPPTLIATPKPAKLAETMVQPGMRSLLDRLKDATEKEDWIGATEILETIIKMSSSSEIRARYLKVLGSVLMDKRTLVSEAVESWSRALDETPEDLGLFVKMIKALQRRERWWKMEEQYRKMIDRTNRGSGDHRVLTNLWHGLGCLYRDKLGKEEAAALCFEQKVRFE